jgi:hypothetical protein
MQTIFTLLSDKIETHGMFLIYKLERNVSGGGIWDIKLVSITGATGG